MTDHRPQTADYWKAVLIRPSPFVVFAGLTVIILAFFAPVLPTYFLTDDYNYVGHLLVNARHYVQGEQLGKWFIDFSAQGLQNPILSVFFRPVVQWLWLTDFIAWGADAFGYHLTNIILHALNSFLVYLLATQVLRHRLGAVVAGLLFALHPIHADSVAWIPDRTDVLSALFYFSSAVFFVLYRRRARRLYGALSLVAFALAIGAKENAVALPLVLFAYDVLFTFRALRRRILVAQIPYWLILVGYVGARFLFLGQFGRNTGGGFLSYGWELFAQFYMMALAQPFIADIDTVLLFGILAFSVVVLFICRRHAPVWFGVLWILVSLSPSASAAYVAPRLAYAPSAGLVIALAAIFVQPLAKQTNLSRVLGSVLFAFFALAYGWGLAVRVDDWVAAGSVADAVRSETLRLHPTVPPDARLYYTGVPDILRGIHIYNDNFDAAIRIVYKNPSLAVARVEQFPILTDSLDRAYFLEYRRRKITERADLINVLQARKRCAAKPAITWDFSRDHAGWEAWNQITALQTRNGTLMMQSEGDDPNLGGPPIDLSALAIGDIEIEMRVRADAPTTQGAVFWIVNDQNDFLPAQQQMFPVQADNTFHTYRVDIARDGKLNFGDRVTRLRFDPVQVPGEIALRAIRVYVYCSLAEGVTCQCPQ